MEVKLNFSKLKAKIAAVDKKPPPTFILDANDPFAPTLIRNWAAWYFEAKGGRGMQDEEHAKYLGALETAIAMERWHRAKNTGAQ